VGQRGRPRKELDEEQILKLAQIGCTYQVIADWFGVNRSTIIANYKEIVQEGHLEVKQSLRRAQLQTALKGNVSMLIWLGKQMLGQKDTPQEVTNAVKEIKLGGKDDNK
jgi:hypothetical protein